MSRIINKQKGKTMNDRNRNTQHNYSVEEQHHIIGSQHDPAAAKPKKKKRVFMWFFLIVQAVFVFWLIAGIAGSGGTPADCGTLDAQTCSDAKDVGTGIGVMLVVVLWCIVDFLLAIVWAVTRFARRS